MPPQDQQYNNGQYPPQQTPGYPLQPQMGQDQYRGHQVVQEERESTIETTICFPSLMPPAFLSPLAKKDKGGICAWICAGCCLYACLDCIC